MAVRLQAEELQRLGTVKSAYNEHQFVKAYLFGLSGSVKSNCSVLVKRLFGLTSVRYKRISLYNELAHFSHLREKYGRASRATSFFELNMRPSFSAKRCTS